jgi:hypothetical protein
LISFQIITFVHSVNESYTAPYSIFHVFSMLNTNPIDLKSLDNNIYNVQQVIPFSQGNQQFSIKVMLGIGLSLALIFAILNTVKYWKRLS